MYEYQRSRSLLNVGRQFLPNLHRCLFFIARAQRTHRLPSLQHMIISFIHLLQLAKQLERIAAVSSQQETPSRVREDRVRGMMLAFQRKGHMFKSKQGQGIYHFRNNNGASGWSERMEAIRLRSGRATHLALRMQSMAERVAATNRFQERFSGGRCGWVAGRCYSRQLTTNRTDWNRGERCGGETGPSWQLRGQDAGNSDDFNGNQFLQPRRRALLSTWGGTMDWSIPAMEPTQQLLNGSSRTHIERKTGSSGKDGLPAEDLGTNSAPQQQQQK